LWSTVNRGVWKLRPNSNLHQFQFSTGKYGR
jgi:hypothetical protein